MNLFSIYLPKTIFDTSQKINKKIWIHISSKNSARNCILQTYTVKVHWKCSKIAFKNCTCSFFVFTEQFVFLSVKYFQHSFYFHAKHIPGLLFFLVCINQIFISIKILLCTTANTTPLKLYMFCPCQL